MHMFSLADHALVIGHHPEFPKPLPTLNHKKNPVKNVLEIFNSEESSQALGEHEESKHTPT